MNIYRSHVLVCGGTGCTSSGSKTLQAEFTKQIKENIDGFKWTLNDKSKLQILEHPIWSREFSHSPTYKYYDPETIGT